MTTDNASSQLALDALSSSSKLLSLPLELRKKICSIIFDTSPYYEKSPNEITLVCRQTRNDSIPIWLEWKNFAFSLAHFIRWTARAPPDLLLYVHKLSINIDTNLVNVSMIGNSLDHHSPFNSLPQLRHFSLQTDRSFSHRSLRHEEVQITDNVLLAMASLCPLLESFKSHPDCRMHLDFLTKLPKLRDFTWSGYSESTPEETLIILGALPCLDNVHIRRIYGEDRMSGQLSFTDHVLRGLKPLQTLRISQPKDSGILTAAFIQAILTSHRDTLSFLRVSCHSKIDRVVFDEIIRVLPSLNLKGLFINLFVRNDPRPINLTLLAVHKAEYEKLLHLVEGQR